MQRPTLQNVRIRSTRDALQVFNGVANNQLPLITRRLDAEERRAIISGNVYVWEERGASTEPTGLGMERWTDGMGWGPSRVRDEFLFYHQKESDISDDLINPVTPWAQMMRKRELSGSRMPGSVYSSSQASESERLVKQTYSVHVSLPVDRPRGIIRKWHLTAYFSQQRLDALETIDSIRGIGDVAVPDGWFRSARARKPGRDNRNPGKNPQPLSEGGPLSSSVINPTYSSSPTNSRYPPSTSSYRHGSTSPPLSDHSSISSQSGAPILSSGSRPPAKLVPLEYLQNISGSRRNPVDEQLLSRFSSKTLVPAPSVRAPSGDPSLRDFAPQH
ncbi:Gti1/Pac2 family-domain-containing protein [Collybia nuda]|uniref:Gti1/Pac2 family-domain-containing protein n=1 Tax=Collybia nuda TaxID=64659 RepID=A0A9P6CG86_9AGAR|nr:Gti1/Pac2 family-domain-containing protein [Collybia nuda]